MQHDTEAEVLRTIYAFLDAWMLADAEAVEAILGYIAEDFTGLGTGPGDYYPSRTAFHALIEREKKAMPYPSTTEVVWMNARVLGQSLALVEGQLRSEIQMEADTHVVEPRCSFVLQRQAARWLIVHCHFSVSDVMQKEGDTLKDALEGRNRVLERQVAQRTAELNQSIADLKAAQARLVQQEKMASLGALTAGIAHEIKNPLNFVNNFAALSRELVDELDDETDPEEIQAILADLKMNAAKIEEHGKRADGIVHSMMQHARAGSGEREAVDLNALIAEHIALAYHGKRAQIPDFNVEIEQDLDAAVGEVEVVPQEIRRVLLNLVGNAFDAVRERAGSINGPYTSTVTVTTRRMGHAVEIRVADNGPGIGKEVRERIFEPFFTTKPTGQGTGLGLSLSYDIITQGHGGTLAVESTPGHGATFVITLPG